MSDSTVTFASIAVGVLSIVAVLHNTFCNHPEVVKSQIRQIWDWTKKSIRFSAQFYSIAFFVYLVAVIEFPLTRSSVILLCTSGALALSQLVLLLVTAMIKRIDEKDLELLLHIKAEAESRHKIELSLANQISSVVNLLETKFTADKQTFASITEGFELISNAELSSKKKKR